MNLKAFRKWVSNQRAQQKRDQQLKSNKKSSNNQASVLGKRLRTEVTSEDLDNFDSAKRLCFALVDWTKLGPEVVDPQAAKLIQQFGVPSIKSNKFFEKMGILDQQLRDIAGKEFVRYI